MKNAARSKSENGDQAQRILSLGDVAQRLDVSVRTVQKWVRDGRLTVVRLGVKTTRVLEEDLTRFLQSSREGQIEEE